MSMTALIIDDDPAFRRLVSTVVGSHGHRLIEARSGDQASALLADVRPDVIVVDGLLPGSDGISWIAGFRQRDAQTPIVFISAFSFAKDVKTHKRLTAELGVAMVLSKPIQHADLWQALSTYLHDTPNKAPDGDLAERFAALTREYAGTLLAQVNDLAAAIGQAESTLNGADLEQAQLKAHRLCGTAGSYGFTEVGTRAGHIEEALATFLSQGPSAEGWRGIARAIRESRQLASAEANAV